MTHEVLGHSLLINFLMDSNWKKIYSKMTLNRRDCFDLSSTSHHFLLLVENYFFNRPLRNNFLSVFNEMNDFMNDSPDYHINDIINDTINDIIILCLGPCLGP